MAHELRSFCCVTEAGQQRIENALIAEPLCRVNTHDIGYLFSVVLSFGGILPQGNCEQVQVFLVLVGLRNRLCDEMTDFTESDCNSGDIQRFQSARELPGGGGCFTSRSVVFLRAGNQLLDFGRKRRETVGHLLHFIGKRLHGGSKSGHLLCELVNVRRFQILDHLRQLGELIDKGSHIGLTQLGERA